MKIGLGTTVAFFQPSHSEMSPTSFLMRPVCSRWIHRHRRQSARQPSARLLILSLSSATRREARLPESLISFISEAMKPLGEGLTAACEGRYDAGPERGANGRQP